MENELAEAIVRIEAYLEAKSKSSMLDHDHIHGFGRIDGEFNLLASDLRTVLQAAKR